MTLRTQVEPEMFGATVVQSAVAGDFHLLDHLGNFLEIIDVEIVFVDLLGIKGCEDFQLHNKTPVAQMLTTEIAREVQHNNRILPDKGAGSERVSRSKIVSLDLSKNRETLKVPFEIIFGHSFSQFRPARTQPSDLAVAIKTRKIMTDASISVTFGRDFVSGF